MGGFNSPNPPVNSNTGFMSMILPMNIQRKRCVFSSSPWWFSLIETTICKAQIQHVFRIYTAFLDLLNQPQKLIEVNIAVQIQDQFCSRAVPLPDR